MNIIMLDEHVDWLYDQIVYQENTWQVHEDLLEELFETLEDIRQKGYERSLCSKFKVDKYMDNHRLLCRKSGAIYLPFRQSLVKINRM